MGEDANEKPMIFTAVHLSEVMKLWNERRYFEIHEYLEHWWISAQGQQRILLHVLLHCSVSMHLKGLGRIEGALRQHARTLHKIRKLTRCDHKVIAGVFLCALEENLTGLSKSVTADVRDRLTRLERELNL